MLRDPASGRMSPAKRLRLAVALSVKQTLARGMRNPPRGRLAGAPVGAAVRYLTRYFIRAWQWRGLPLARARSLARLEPIFPVKLLCLDAYFADRPFQTGIAQMHTSTSTLCGGALRRLLRVGGSLQPIAAPHDLPYTEAAVPASFRPSYLHHPSILALGESQVHQIHMPGILFDCCLHCPVSIPNI